MKVVYSAYETFTSKLDTSGTIQKLVEAFWCLSCIWYFGIWSCRGMIQSNDDDDDVDGDVEKESGHPS